MSLAVQSVTGFAVLMMDVATLPPVRAVGISDSQLSRGHLDRLWCFLAGLPVPPVQG